MIERTVTFPNTVSAGAVAKALVEALEPLEARARPLLMSQIRQVAPALVAALAAGRIFYRYEAGSACYVIAARRRRAAIRVGLWAHLHGPQDVVCDGLPGPWRAMCLLCPEAAARLARLEYYARARAGVFGLPLPAKERRHYWRLIRPLLREGAQVWAVDHETSPPGIWLLLRGFYYLFLSRWGFRLSGGRQKRLSDAGKFTLLRLEWGEVTREEAEAELILQTLRGENDD